MGTVSHTLKNLPSINQKTLDKVATMDDNEIDYTDIPNLAGTKLRAKPIIDHSMYKPVKIALTCRLDADIVAWLKQDGKGYQTRLNSILRHVMMKTQ